MRGNLINKGTLPIGKMSSIWWPGLPSCMARAIASNLFNASNGFSLIAYLFWFCKNMAIGPAGAIGDGTMLRLYAPSKVTFKVNQ